ncbi:MAG: isochorismatase family protein [Deltaproteobacteria bacterium]|nr:isochorismatase family protein [Deltaproteobacteria bacterium]
MIVNSLTNRSTPENILPPAAPVGNEPVDKFYNAELENIPLGKKIEVVVIVETTTDGAVLHTATGAAMRGFNIVVPVDGMSAGALYAEQYTC